MVNIIKEYSEKYPQDTIIEKDLNKIDFLQVCINTIFLLNF